MLLQLPNVSWCPNHPWLRTHVVESAVKTADILVDTARHTATEREKTKGHTHVRSPRTRNAALQGWFNVWGVGSKPPWKDRKCHGMMESSVVFVSAEIIDKKHLVKQINCQSGLERPWRVRTDGKQWRLLTSGHGRGRGKVIYSIPVGSGLTQGNLHMETWSQVYVTA